MRRIYGEEGGMENLLLIIIELLLLLIFVLVAKVYSLRKSAQEIA